MMFAGFTEGRVVPNRAWIRISPTACGLLLAVAAILALGMAPARSQSQELDCGIEPRTVTKLASPVAGVVDEIGVDRGTWVKKGQGVAKLRSGVEEAPVRLARARAESAIKVESSSERTAYEQRKLARAEVLSKRDVVSGSKLDDARTETRLAMMALRDAEFEKKIAELELARSEELLALRSVRSPVDGVVVNLLLSPGEYSNEQAHVMTIAQMDPLYVEVFAPVAMFGAVVPGMEAEVRPEPPVGGVYTAKVDVVNTVLDAASRTFGVRLLLPNPQYKLPGGLRCKVRFAGGTN